MLDPTYIYYILIGALSLISLSLMIVPVGKNKHLEGYALSVRLLAISFIVMSACCAAACCCRSTSARWRSSINSFSRCISFSRVSCN